MALGFDMADPICKPPVTQHRLDDWVLFLQAWNKKPVFAGRYFGAAYSWVPGEIPTDLKTRIPGYFDELKYVCPFTPTGLVTMTRTVDINGEPMVDADGKPLVDPSGKPLGYVVAFEEQGETRQGGKLPKNEIREL